jgi:hypothetical protein
MKQYLVAAIVVTIIFAGSVINPAISQKDPLKVKIGTYDSRVITLSYSRSAFFKQYLGKLNTVADSAKKVNDTVKYREANVQMMSYQHLLHLRVFGTGSVGSVMDLVADQLPGLAKKAGVSMILSKWEINYQQADVEIVDLTDEIAQLFKPAENIKKITGDITKQTPIPLEDLSVEEDMLKLYCKRFGEK